MQSQTTPHPAMRNSNEIYADLKILGHPSIDQLMLQTMTMAARTQTSTGALVLKH